MENDPHTDRGLEVLSCNLHAIGRLQAIADVLFAFDTETLSLKFTVKVVY